MPAFGYNRYSLPFILRVFEAEDWGFRLSDRIASALDRFCGDIIGRFASTTYPGWERWSFIYPFIGGIAETHGLNLADLENYNIIWSATGVTHSAIGVTFASGGSGATGVDCGSTAPDFPKNWVYKSFGLYSRTNSAATARNMNASAGSNSQGMHIRYTDGNGYFDNNFPSNRVAGAVADSLGLFIVSRMNGTDLRAYKRGVQIGTTNTTGAIGLTGSAPMTFQDVRNWGFAFSTVHNGFFSAAENAVFDYFVQRFQVALGRAV